MQVEPPGIRHAKSVTKSVERTTVFADRTQPGVGGDARPLTPRTRREIYNCYSIE